MGEAVGFLCPVCGSVGPHPILWWVVEDRTPVELRVHCTTCEASFTVDPGVRDAG